MSKKYTVGIITISDKASKGERIDESGPLMVQDFRKEIIHLYWKVI